MQDLITKLNQFPLEDVNLHILTRNKKTKEYGILTTEPNENVRQGLIDLAIAQLTNMIERHFIGEEYSPVIQYDANTYETITEDQITTLLEILPLMEGDLNVYNSRDLPEKSQLWAYIIVLRNETIMFQKIQPRKILKSGKKLLVIEKENGYFSKIEESVLTFDQMDCILDEEIMYIFHKYNFENIFGIIENFQEEIETSLASIPDEGILVDKDEFSTFCFRDRNKLKKLYHIIQNGGFRLLTRENVDRLNQTHELGLQFENGIIKLSPRDTQKVLNLMNEDCVNSTLTEDPFVAHHKSPVKRQT